MTQKRNPSEPTVVWWHSGSGWVTHQGHSMPIVEAPKFATVKKLTWLEYRPYSSGPHDLADADGVTRPMSQAEIDELEARCRRMKEQGIEGWLSEPAKSKEKKKKTCP